MGSSEYSRLDVFNAGDFLIGQSQLLVELQLGHVLHPQFPDVGDVRERLAVEEILTVLGEVRGR